MTPPTDPSDPAVDPRDRERPGHGERLLVVDDEHDIADLLRAGLRFVGYDVRVAFSGAEALAVTDEFRPQLVLMDVMLPDISGFELCRQIRAGPRPDRRRLPDRAQPHRGRHRRSHGRRR